MTFTFSTTVNVDINEIVKGVIDILVNEYDDIIDEAIRQYAKRDHDDCECALIMKYSSREKIYKEIIKILDSLIKK